MPDKFPAKITKSGTSKVITIPYLIAEAYEVGQKVKVVIEKST